MANWNKNCENQKPRYVYVLHILYYIFHIHAQFQYMTENNFFVRENLAKYWISDEEKKTE